MVSDEPKSAADGGQLTLLAIKEFAEELASRCLADAVETGQSFGRKEVNDPLWGTVSLTPSEVALLDTPLIQRLRYVRQLGVAQWTYPGAIHTRLSHTLGALHQVQTLASAINVAAAEAGEPLLIAPMQIRILRLAALLHDIGHCAFSHVTEKALAEVTCGFR
jgi:HD superfamily phosphohydrolase